MGIQKLKIRNFKSIVDISLDDIPGLAVFAGPNGSGKSNFFEALEFVRDVYRYGAGDAIKRHGGYENIHSHKLRDRNARRFEAELEVNIGQDHYIYKIKITEMHKSPRLYEEVIKNGQTIAQKHENGTLHIDGEATNIDYADDESILKLVSKEAKSLNAFISAIERYQVDPYRAREADEYSAADVLDRYASNLPTVLKRLEKDQDTLEAILEAMQLIVPGLESVASEKEQLNNKSVVVFKEEGVRKRFPANLVSDGTIYALAMLLIIYSNDKGIVMIEEPERGLHPKAIAELMEIFRERSEDFNIFINTHSESVVRNTKPEELFLVDKIEGRTRIIQVKSEYPDYDYNKMPIDTMWMSNFFDGGLPW